MARRQYLYSRGWYIQINGRFTMIQDRQRRGFLLIAVIAIGVALVCLMIPQSHAGNSADWLAILPLLFVGIISPLSLIPRRAFAYVGRTPDAPSLPSRFQRPPPSRRG
jgi:hypothetical protein